MLIYVKLNLCPVSMFTQIFQWSLCSESETIQPNELPYPAVINFRVHMLHFFKYFWTYVAYRTSLSLCLSNIWCMEVIETPAAGLLLDQDSGRTHYLVKCKCNH